MNFVGELVGAGRGFEEKRIEGRLHAVVRVEIEEVIGRGRWGGGLVVKGKSAECGRDDGCGGASGGVQKEVAAAQIDRVVRLLWPTQKDAPWGSE